MYPILAYVATFISGALLTALGLYVALFGKVKDMEARITVVERDMTSEKIRNDQRIDSVREAVAAILATANEVLKQNTVLIAEIRAARKDA